MSGLSRRNGSILAHVNALTTTNQLLKLLLKRRPVTPKVAGSSRSRPGHAANKSMYVPSPYVGANNVAHYIKFARLLVPQHPRRASIALVVCGR